MDTCRGAAYFRNFAVQNETMTKCMVHMTLGVCKVRSSYILHF